MKLNTRSLFMSLITLSAFLCLQASGRADTFHRAVVNGRYHLNSPYATGINVMSYATTYAATGKTVPGGTITIYSNVMNVHAGVASLTVDTMSITALIYKHARVTSTSFYYKGVTAHAVVEIVPYTLYGQAGFQIIRDSDGAILYASWPKGFYTMVSLEWGGVGVF